MSSTSQKSVGEVFRGPVRSDDRELVAAMALLAVGTLVAAAWLGGSLRTSAAAFYLGAGTYFAGLALLVAAVLRLAKHYSVAGISWFGISIFLFQLWNAVVMWASILTGWSGPHQPGYHLVISAAGGLIPMLVGIWKLWRRLGRTGVDA